MRTLLKAFVLLAILASPVLADLTADATSALEAMTTTLERDGALELDGQKVMAWKLVIEFYADNGYAPVWTDPATVGKMLQAIADMRDDGLAPADYHGPTLTALGTTTPDDAGALARRDLLLTDALLVMLYHLDFGKADPSRLDTDWNINDLFDERDPLSSEVREEITSLILDGINQGDIGPMLQLARPDLHLYQNLRVGLAFYRELTAAGGWPEIPEGPTLRKDDNDPRVLALRRRLAVTRDFAGVDLTSTVLDEDLVAGIVRFQARHGLDDDGIVGKGTLAALNVSAEDRMKQIEINLERARWVMHHGVGGDLVLVNIAAYEAVLIRNKKGEWRSRVQVGKPYTRTPVFADEIVYLEINPTWTIPASITNTTTLAKAKADPGYFAANHMVLLDSQGSQVDPHSVDWAKLNRMPYTVRQEPGPHNALGLVKFIFPNVHAVYLHDTPSRQHFSRSARAFSHGCIRLENPFDLATLLLDDQPKWTRAKIDEVVESGKRTTVKLTKTMPILLLYWTAFSETAGSVQFRQDLYDRDAAVLKALQGPVLPHKRHRR